ncbi:MAG TPA: alpha/beta hydrolase [Alphaproteobacteria bacterium]
MSVQIPQELWALMAEIGPRWGENTGGHVKLMVDEFTKVHKLANKTGVEVKRDIAYGPHPRQNFDVFRPASPGQRRPAVLFVHGGAFVDGHRNRTDEIYANVSYYFARHGIVGVNIGYRLAGDASYPEASRDIGAVVQWTHQHAGELGVDPSRIFLMGHSAGGAHVGSYAYDRRLHPAGGPGIAGLIVVSGRVRADNLPENPNARKVEAYYGPDSSRYDDCSAVSHAGADSVPTLVAWSEYENPLIDVYCAELAYRLAAAKRRSPPVVYLKGHNHTSMIGHINTAEDVLGQAMREFIDRPR